MMLVQMLYLEFLLFLFLLVLVGAMQIQAQNLLVEAGQKRATYLLLHPCPGPSIGCLVALRPLSDGPTPREAL